ncbi:DUF3109 family protein [Pollutibacter soli]|uniref:DUF3109 family protein n=1 Tax=Pollutibacter soli TaxID=3034157 RepID=UPI0030134FC3
MIVIDKVLISDDVVEEQFVCDLNKCKGGCCEDGDAGAPLTMDELDIVADVFETIKPLLTPEGLEEINRKGLYRYDKEFGWVTPTVGGKICAYGSYDKNGIIRCAFEEAKNRGLIDWKKPISCHLYPIKTKKSRYNDHEMVNYEPRESLCSPGCALGAKLKVPVYQFLKEAITRKFGEEFYNVLHQIAENSHDVNKKVLP